MQPILAPISVRSSKHNLAVKAVLPVCKNSEGKVEAYHQHSNSFVNVILELFLLSSYGLLRNESNMK